MLKASKFKKGKSFSDLEGEEDHNADFGMLIKKSPESKRILPILLLFACLEGISVAFFRFFGFIVGVQAAPNIFVASVTLPVENIFIACLIIMLLYYFIKNYCYQKLVKIVLNISIIIHDQMIEATLKTNTSFLEHQSQNRIINRFTTDVGILDTQVSVAFIDALEGVFALLLFLINIFILNYYLLIPGFITFYFYLKIVGPTKKITLESKRLEQQEKGSIYSFF